MTNARADEVWALLEADKEFVASLERGIADMKAGRTRAWADVKRDIDAVEVTTPIDPSVPDESANDEPDALPEPTDEQAPEGPKNEPIPEEAI